MNKKSSSKAFVLTGDEPISSQTLKRLLLTHSKVYFTDISDEAIINDGEVMESFPKGKFLWAARGHYPRVDGYKERYLRCLKGAESVLDRSLLQPIASHNIRNIDPGIHWMCYNASLSNNELVCAASIDASLEKPNLHSKNTILFGTEISQSGMKSKYAVDYKPPVDLTGIHQDWNWIARLRVGRMLKSIRISQALDASPIAVDSINSEICYSLMKQSSPFSFTDESLMDFAIDTAIVDIEKLESNLLEAPWEDIVKIRKEILPAVSKTKDFLEEKTYRISSRTYSGPEQYIKALNEFKADFNNLKDDESEAWEALRIGSVLKAGGSAGVLGLGTIAIPSITSLPVAITALISAGLVSVASLNPELKKLIPARRKLRDHPLYLIEKLTR
jgi:hypothetical protein